MTQMLFDSNIQATPIALWKVNIDDPSGVSAMQRFMKCRLEAWVTDDI